MKHHSNRWQDERERERALEIDTLTNYKKVFKQDKLDHPNSSQNTIKFYGLHIIQQLREYFAKT